MREHIRFFLNGAAQVVRGDAAFITLAEYLRQERCLTGTKIVCAEGDCGACTVLVSGGRARNEDRMLLEPIDACIRFVFQLDGMRVMTVDGLAPTGEMHPVQRALIDCHGSQCGYCTPGFVMALAGWAESNANMDRRIALTGNLCRCTGYVPILEAASRVAGELPRAISRRIEAETVRETKTLPREPIRVDAGAREYFAPTQLDEAIAYMAANSNAVIVAGATELGVHRNKRGLEPTKYLSLAQIDELDALEVDDNAICIGANVSWADIEGVVRERLPQFVRIVERFGSPQIRNVATVVGNVANGSPIADSLPLLMVMDADLEIVGPQGTRRRSINGFYTGYKQMDLRPGELIARVNLPLPSKDDRLRLYKVSRRTDLDIATFGAAIRLRMNGERIDRAAIAFSGVAPTVVRLPKTEETLVGQLLEERTFQEAGWRARNEVMPLTDVRGTRDFRLQLCENVLRKFHFDDVAAMAEVNS